jgi:hypothetical protein
VKGRLLGLHLRARHLYLAAVGVGLVAVLAWLAEQWLVNRPYAEGPGARLPVVAFAPMLAAVLLGPTLAGADEELERATPLAWWRWRLGQVLLSCGVIGGALALTGLSAPDDFGAHALLRNSLACAGLVVASAAALGAQLSWLPAFGYISAVVAASPSRTDTVAQIWGWPVQPSTVDASWWTAVIIFVLGTAVYVITRRRRSTPRREA